MNFFLRGIISQVWAVYFATEKKVQENGNGQETGTYSEHSEENVLVNGNGKHGFL
ncbi:MAG: hypothetical protein KDD55_13545 [Bdellovibrionales bacterium]|nr:hypothetical protein [Bdellovibrionales bacterium]